MVAFSEGITIVQCDRVIYPLEFNPRHRLHGNHVRDAFVYLLAYEYRPLPSQFFNSECHINRGSHRTVFSTLFATDIPDNQCPLLIAMPIRRAELSGIRVCGVHRISTFGLPLAHDQITLHFLVKCVHDILHFNGALYRPCWGVRH